MEGHLLHDLAGALSDQCDGHWMGAHAVAGRAECAGAYNASGRGEEGAEGQIRAAARFSSCFWTNEFPNGAVSAPMRIVGLILVILLLFGGCLSQLPSSTSSPQTMCHAPGGGYVPCNFGYHGSQGP